MLAAPMLDRVRSCAEQFALDEANLDKAEAIFGKYPNHPAKKPVLWLAAEQARAAREAFEQAVADTLRALR